jgi:hypothetical protein
MSFVLTRLFSPRRFRTAEITAIIVIIRATDKTISNSICHHGIKIPSQYSLLNIKPPQLPKAATKKTCPLFKQGKFVIYCIKKIYNNITAFPYAGTNPTGSKGPSPCGEHLSTSFIVRPQAVIDFILRNIVSKVKCFSCNFGQNIL